MSTSRTTTPATEDQQTHPSHRPTKVRQLATEPPVFVWMQLDERGHSSTVCLPFLPVLRLTGLAGVTRALGAPAATLVAADGAVLDEGATHRAGALYAAVFSFLVTRHRVAPVDLDFPAARFVLAAADRGRCQYHYR